MGRSRIGGQPPGESDVHGPDRKGLFSLSMALAEPYLAGAEATATQIKNELRNKTLALERVQRHSGPTTIQVMSDSEAKLDRLFYVESPKTSYLIADN
ncbi:hypothetical protein Tco_0673426 [Tanacetum coccineum]|uniref:Uncharacterized protein n=1 Tax=Tanacetum coccineum TaxID=301880 RepID=A0ABQ5HRZ7_9ASTR